MHPISGVIVSYNEQKNIRYALESLLPISSEIILIDSFSTDKTIEIAQQYKCNIYNREFDNHRNTKNFGIEKCNNKWIFVLDADEIIPTFLANQIENILKRAELEEIDAIGIPRFNCIDGIGPKGFPDWQVRLTQKHIRYTGHPSHHTNTENSRKQAYWNQYGYILHMKTQEMQEADNRGYFALRPQDYQTLPEGVTPEFAEQCKEAVKNTNPENPNLYQEIIKKGLL